MKNLRVLVSLLIMASLHPNHAPGQPPPAGDGDAGPWRGRWILARLVDGGGERPLGDAQITLHLASDGAVTGSMGVNRYQGRYAADPDGGLRWLARFQSTQLAGPDALVKLELAYLSVLAGAARWQVLPAIPELRLSTPDGKTVLTFRRQAP